jgi:site-specific recombinase XerD
VPLPNQHLVEGWQLDLENRVELGELTDTMRRAYEWGFAQFLDWLHHNRNETVSPTVIQDWVSSLRGQGYNSFSVAFWLSCVQSFFSWAYSNGGFLSDPTNGVRSGKTG